MGGVDEVQALRLTPVVRKVLGALLAAGRRKVAVREVACTGGVTRSAAAGALHRLDQAGLACHVQQQHVPDRPPHAVWWLTGAGRAVAQQVGSAPDV